MLSRLAGARLRTWVLVGVLAVTLIALAGFDVAAVTALRGYLLTATDSQIAHAIPVPSLSGASPSLAWRAAQAIEAFNRTLPGQVDSAVNESVARLGVILVIGSVAVGVLVFLGVTVVVRRGLLPIEAMAARADRITAGDLTERVSPENPATEVGRLGAALNGMLARIETFVEEREASAELTRRFFADASHELRTPLASLRANAELYQQGALPERHQVDEAMRRIALEAQRMSGLVDDMLRLARLDQHPDGQFEPVDLTAVVTGCCERAQIADPARTWHADIASGLVLTGDAELLGRAVDNLLANVRAHTPAGTTAAIVAATRGGAVIVEVSDNGPGVQVGQLCRVFDRFYRGGAPSERPGSGLGLAIVAAIVAAHGGTAEACLNHPHGLRMTMTLPASSQCGGQPGRADSEFSSQDTPLRPLTSPAIDLPERRRAGAERAGSAPAGARSR
jgi:signal transduction histidine kinase